MSFILTRWSDLAISMELAYILVILVVIRSSTPFSVLLEAAPLDEFLHDASVFKNTFLPVSAYSISKQLSTSMLISVLFRLFRFFVSTQYSDVACT